MTMVMSGKDLVRRAKAVLNPAQIAISLAWYDRTFGTYYVYGFFPLSQKESDDNPWPVSHCRSAMGSGATPQAAIAALENKFYGGL